MFPVKYAKLSMFDSAEQIFLFYSAMYDLHSLSKYRAQFCKHLLPRPVPLQLIGLLTVESITPSRKFLQTGYNLSGITIESFGGYLERINE